MDCPKCGEKNSVTISTMSVKGTSVEVSLACDQCKEMSPYYKETTETINIDTIYKTWSKSY